MRLSVVASTVLSGISVVPPLITAFSVKSAIPTLRRPTAPTSRLFASPHFSEVSDIPVQTLENTTATLGELVQVDETIVLSCLSHFGDFNAWELTQQYISALESTKLETSSPIILVGIGSLEAAHQFASDLELEKYKDRMTLVADETGAVTEALGCYKGWLSVDQTQKERYPHTDVNPYLKLLGMIFGFGSPGTIEKVLYGYVGDVTDRYGSDGRQWVVNSLLQGSEKERYPLLTKAAFAKTPDEATLRPFELATLRLQTGLHIVKNWGKLGPKDGDLFTRMGGSFVFNGGTGQCVWDHFDQGILCYADIDTISLVNEATNNGEEWVTPPSAKLQREMAKDLRQRTRARFKAREEAEMREKEEAEERIRKVVEERARLKREEEDRKRAEEEARRKAEEEAVIQAQAEEEAARQAKEEARLRAEEEARLRVLAEDAEFRARAEEVGYMQQAQEVLSKVDQYFQEEATSEAPNEVALNANVTVSVSDFNINESVATEEKVVVDLRDRFSRNLHAAQLQSEPQEAIVSPATPAVEFGEPLAAKETVVLDPRPQERFQRRLLAARLQYERQSARAVPHAQARDDEVDEPLAARETVILDPRLRELFQRRLLAARLQYERQPPRTVPDAQARDDDVDVDEPSVAKETVILDPRLRELFQRRLLAARLEYERKAPITVPDAQARDDDVDEPSVAKESVVLNPWFQEIFQRRLLAARLEYERRAARVVSDPQARDGDVDRPLAVKEAVIIDPHLQELFQRRLLAARLQYERQAASYVPDTPSFNNDVETLVSQDSVVIDPDLQERFQRSLLAARLHYEWRAARAVREETVIPTSSDHHVSSHQERFQRQLLQARIRNDQATATRNGATHEAHSLMTSAESSDDVLLSRKKHNVNTRAASSEKTPEGEQRGASVFQGFGH